MARNAATVLPAVCYVLVGSRDDLASCGGEEMTKQKYIRNAPDFKDENGLWVRTYNPKPYESHTTRSGVLWGSINQRCKVGGGLQCRRPTYIGVTNGFKDFQEFAGWCQHQYGYLNKEKNGRCWQLDKDLKVFGNKEYSKETCIFVPSRVNSLLLSSNASRGEFPLGVHWRKDVQKFQSKCSRTKVRLQHLGYFDCRYKAHQAWQRYKVELIRKVCVEDEEIRNHLELVPILLAQAQRIEDDLLNGRETV
jgi:hypothetical protein